MSLFVTSTRKLLVRTAPPARGGHTAKENIVKPRKTIAVNDIRNRVNSMLALPLSRVSRDAKVTLCCMVEDVLMSTNNYKGFSFDNPQSETKDDDHYNRYYM